jgi:hypothetical protein
MRVIYRFSHYPLYYLTKKHGAMIHLLRNTCQGHTYSPSCLRNLTLVYSLYLSLTSNSVYSLFMQPEIESSLPFVMVCALCSCNLYSETDA